MPEVGVRGCPFQMDTQAKVLRIWLYMCAKLSVCSWMSRELGFAMSLIADWDLERMMKRCAAPSPASSRRELLGLWGCAKRRESKESLGIMYHV